MSNTNLSTAAPSRSGTIDDDGVWVGKQKRGGRFDVEIFDAPVKQLKHSGRWMCFHRLHSGDKGDYKIALAHNPKDKDPGAIIYYVEYLIVQGFRNFK